MVSVLHTVKLIPGFDMSTMSTTYFDDGLIDVNEAKEIVTNECIIKVSPLDPAKIGLTSRTSTLKQLQSRA